VSTIVSPQTNVPIESAQGTLVDNKIDRAVLVQPVFRAEDNSYVAGCARAQPRQYAAVCVVDPRLARAEERLEYWVAQGCVGLRLRPRIAAEEKTFGDPATWPLWEAAGRLRVVVSVLCGPEHAPAIAALADRFRGVSIVVDHMGHPDVGGGPLSPSFAQLLALARHPNVLLKVSGFYHFSAQPFPYADCWEMIRALYDQFGPGRLIWGSDFPHVVPSCGYERAMMLP
jgi:predicted TIM-barrel fold metal-dependent hydrolase